MSVKTLVIKEAKTHAIRIDVKNDLMNGYFTGHAKVRPMPEVEALRERVLEGEFAGREEELMSEMFESFDGFGTESDGFEEVCRGPVSAFLTPAAQMAYFEQFGAARRGNSQKRRSR